MPTLRRNKTGRIPMKWDKDYTVHHQQPGEVDIILSQLPAATKRQLWANIKTRNPAKAAVMQEALAAVGAIFPGCELTLTNTEIEEYLK